FDTHLLSQLPNKKDRRVSFIHEALANLNHVISNYGASVYIFTGTPIDAFAKLESTYEIDAIYANHDYEPYAIQRDLQIRAFADAHNILFKTFKDQVVYEKAEILKPDGNPYTVFTPY